MAAAPLPAAVFIVDTTLVDNTDINPGDGKCEWATFPAKRCTLRAAVHEANALPGADSIFIPNGWTITLSRPGAGEDLNIQGDLDILEDVWIETVSVAGDPPAVINAGGIDRVFDVHSPAELTVKNLVIAGGQSANGAGVNVRSPAARARIFESRLTGNQGLQGVALHAAGGMTRLLYSTVEGNRNQPALTSSAVSRTAGGSLEIGYSTIAANPGIHYGVDNASFATIRDSTIANGSSIGVRSTGDLVLRNVTIYGHPLFGLLHSQPSAFGSPSIINSVIAGNGFSLAGSDCSISTPGGLTDLAHPNLDSDGSCGFSPAFGGIPNTDPMLGPLRDNGGDTHTMAPQVVGGTQSPVIDAGVNNIDCFQDQRGVTRPLNGDVFVFDLSADCDLGAVESLPCNTADPTTFVENVALGNGTTVGCFRVVAGPLVEVQAGATHVFRARQDVEIRNGFQVFAAATFSIVLDPAAGSSVAMP